MLAHSAAAALRATPAIGSALNDCFPAVQVPIWALIAYPPDLPVAVWFDVNGAQVSIASMVPLLLKSRIKMADVWAFVLYTCLLVLTGATAHV